MTTLCGVVSDRKWCWCAVHVGMAAVVETDHEETLERGTRRAQTLLDKLQFNEARAVYREVLRLAPLGGAGTGTCCRSTVAAVSGLAESFARQSRTQPVTADHDQHAVLPWLRLNIQVSEIRGPTTASSQTRVHIIGMGFGHGLRLGRLDYNN